MAPLANENSPYESLARSLLRISTVLRRDVDARHPEVSGVAREIMRCVVREPGLTVAGLAARTGKHVSNTSSMLNLLAGTGYVVRALDERDRRISRVFPTERAEQEVAHLYRDWSDELRACAELLDDADRQAIVAATAALERLVVAAERERPAAQ